MSKSINVIIGTSFPKNGKSWNDASLPSFHYGIANTLKDRGHTVTIVIGSQCKETLPASDGIRIETWPSKRPTSIKDLLFANRLIRACKPQLVLANFGSVNVLLLSSYMNNVKSRIAWYHTMAAAIDRDSSHGHFRLGLLRLRKRFFYRLATRIIPVSQAAANDLTGLFKVPRQKINIIHNAIQDPFAGASVPGPEEREKGSVVCVGRLSPVKGQETLIAAAAILRRKSPELNFRIVFIGDGPTREKLVELARSTQVDDVCQFSGALPNPQTKKAMSLATVAVVPSFIDNLPTTAIESLAAGTPVIGADVGGISEIIRSGQDGWLYPAGDAEKLADKLQLLLTDKELWLRQSISARQHFMDAFNVATAVPRFVDWLEDEVKSVNL
jgi:glycosyltransferase involved in cell wall biosynthesis